MFQNVSLCFILDGRDCFTLFQGVLELKTPRGCLTIKEVMKRLMVSRSTLWRMVKDKHLEFVKLANRRYLKISDIERFQ